MQNAGQDDLRPDVHHASERDPDCEPPSVGAAEDTHNGANRHLPGAHLAPAETHNEPLSSADLEHMQSSVAVNLYAARTQPPPTAPYRSPSPPTACRSPARPSLPGSPPSFASNSSHLLPSSSATPADISLSSAAIPASLDAPRHARPPSTSASRPDVDSSPTIHTSAHPSQSMLEADTRPRNHSRPVRPSFTTSGRLPPPALRLPLITVSTPTTSTSLDTNPQDDLDNDDTPLLMPQTILPLLRCPLCPFSTLLDAPITLHCGHTVCSKHVIRPHTNPASHASTSASTLLSSLLSSDLNTASAGSRCPVPTCTRRSVSDQQTHVHPDSGVNFRPAIPAELPPLPVEDAGAPRIDVTVNKIISLSRRTQRSLDSHLYGAVSPTEHNEGASDEDDEPAPPREPPVAGPSSFPPPTTPGPATSSPLPYDAPTVARRHRSRSRSLPSPPSSPRERPRKRRRLPPSSSAPPAPGRDSRSSDSPPGPMGRRAMSALFEKELLAELTCEICFALLWQPVTTPCQHTFCLKCLLRSMDHSTACPLCRQEIPAYVYAQDQPCNKVVLSIILKAFSAPYAERGAMIEAEERDSRLDTPIFVCQLSFPQMPTILHLFEPRYRLMLRRCLATPNPCFGMIPPPRPTATHTSSGNDFGTMLQIRKVQMLPDGRSVVETWGTWRFRIMERGMFDGYVVARVERVDDLEEEVNDSEETSIERLLDPAALTPSSTSPVPGSSTHVSYDVRSSVASQPIGPPTPALPASGTLLAPTPSNAELMRICHEFLEQLKEGTPWVVQHLDRNYVPMPSDPAQFSFWMTLLLPIDEHEKAKLLPIRSARLRLRLVVHWIEQLRSHWAYSYATASRWQVVLWRVHNLMTRFIRPNSDRDRRVVFATYIILLVAIVWAQVDIRSREVQVVGSVDA